MVDQPPALPSVALLGTGIMGLGMGRSMLRSGLPLHAWNRTPARARALGFGGAVIAATAADAVRDADVIVTMLSDGAAVSAAMTAAAPGLREGQVWAQASTVGVAGLEPLAGLAREHGLLFVDAPVLGTRQPAEQGALTVFAAGPDAARPVLAPVFDAIGRKTVWLGTSPGTASRLKLVVNSWVLAVTTGVAEALALARGLDIDPDLFLQAVAGGPLDCAYPAEQGRRDPQRRLHGQLQRRAGRQGCPPCHRGRHRGRRPAGRRAGRGRPLPPGRGTRPRRRGHGRDLLRQLWRRLARALSPTAANPGPSPDGEPASRPCGAARDAAPASAGHRPR